MRNPVTMVVKPETIYIQKYRNAANGICMFVRKYTFIYACNNNNKRNRLNLRVWLRVGEFGGRVQGDLGKRM